MLEKNYSMNSRSAVRLEATARLETGLERLLERTRRQDRLRDLGSDLTRRKTTRHALVHLVALGLATARALGRTLTDNAALLGLTATARRRRANLGATALLRAALARLGVTRLAGATATLLARLEEIREIRRVAGLDLDRRLRTTRHLVALGLAAARAAGRTLTLGARLLGLTAALRRRAADLGATAHLATAALGLGVTRLASRALFAGLENLGKSTTFDGRHLLYTVGRFVEN